MIYMSCFYFSRQKIQYIVEDLVSLLLLHLWWNIIYYAAAAAKSL